MSIFHPVVQFADNVTGGLFKRRWNDGMNQCASAARPAARSFVANQPAKRMCWK